MCYQDQTERGASVHQHRHPCGALLVLASSHARSRLSSCTHGALK